MNWRLPPLNPLRAFEAAARHGSITAAAGELHVTQTAVSRQVRVLEQAMRQRLFRRSHRRIELTPAGHDYFQAVTRMFRDLDLATREIIGRPRSERLRICGYNAFNMRWLIPRLADFHGRHPGIEVQITSSLEPVDLDRDDLDGTIRSGQSQWEPLDAVFLGPIEFTPVCRPHALGGPRLGRPPDLGNYTLLHSAARPQAWANWLTHFGVASVNTHGGLTFDNSGLCYQAAIEGVGVAIAQTILVADDLKAGRLVQPFDLILKEAGGYYFLSKPRAAKQSLRDFRAWLAATVSAAGSGG